MITLAWYLLKVIICSGILCGYYYLALRNKIFHRWNRFYLLAAVVLSLIVPVMKINIFQSSGQDKGVIKMLQTINNSDEIVIEYSRHSGLQLNSENIISAIYLLITIAFLSVFLLALYKIYRLKKIYPSTKLKGISFISTDAKGTPFSFFKSIFWNNAIDLHSAQGQQIFNHEIAHVKEKHSYDKIFMSTMLIFFWMNPFFWLMRKELNMIHEFIADKEALEESDINAFAAMILQTVYPGQQFSITNNFFHSPIKRRLIMFTKNKNPKVSYISRLLVLPLAAIVFFAFTLKVNTVKSSGGYSGKTITVVIDAGHGGDDNGAVSASGLKEKDIDLAIAKKIAELNSNDHIKILLSRKDDVSMNVKDRVEFARDNHSDLFISIHTNAADKDNSSENGFSVIIDKNNSENNKLLASAIINELQKIYTTASTIGVRTVGVWVLDHNICPAALIECGYITSPADEAFITVSSNQEKIARNILDGIEKYAEQNIESTINAGKLDTIPAAYYKNKELASVVIADEEDSVFIAYKDGRKESITKEELDKRGLLLPPPPPPPPPPQPTLKFDQHALYILDGKITPYSKIEQINSDRIESVNVLKGKDAYEKYGKESRNGVIEIITKPDNNAQKDTIPDKVFTKVEYEAEFPGGQDAWVKYIVSKIKPAINSFTEKDYGTCLVKFIVNTDGTVTNVEATTMKDTHLAKTAMNAIRTGPRWIPATQNGKPVAAYRLQPVTLTNPVKK